MICVAQPSRIQKAIRQNFNAKKKKKATWNIDICQNIAHEMMNLHFASYHGKNWKSRIHNNQLNIVICVVHFIYYVGLLTIANS